MANDTTKIPSGYKQTKIGIIPEDWEVKRLGEIGAFSKGKGVPKKDIKKEGFKCLTYGDLYTKYDIKIEGVKSFIDKETTAISQKIIYGDICFAGSGETIEEIGKSAVFVDDKFGYAGGDIIIFRAKEKLDSLTLSYLLNSNSTRRQTFKIGQGHSVVHIYSSQLQKLQIPLPPLPEQRAIAACLSTWDKAIDKTQKLIEQLKQRNKGLMQQLLTGKIRLKDENGERFCGEWKERKLGEFFNERKETGFEELPLLSIGQNGVYPQSDSDKKDTSNSNKSKYKRICPNDIGYNTMRMWQGRSALSDIEGIVSPAYTIVSPKGNTNPVYFSYLFKMPKVVNLFWRNSQGLVSDTLNCKFKDFKRVKYKFPEKNEQTTIATALDKATQEVQLQEKKLAAMKEQKKGLMQVLLTGKVRLKLINL